MKRSDMLDILAITDDPMELYQISNELELDYMIPDIERVIRTSREYKGWVYHMKSKHKLSVCSHLKIDTFEYDSITIEMHHVIFLYEIVYITGLAMLAELKPNEYYTSFDIASRVIRDHMSNIIPIVPLLKSLHQMYHEGLFEFNKKRFMVIIINGLTNTNHSYLKI